MALEGLKQVIQRHAYDLGDRAARSTETAIKADAPVGKEGGGATRDSVQVRATGRGSSTVTFEAVATTPQAKFTDEGTRAHTITGRPLLAFHWKKIGRFMVLPRVNIPAQPAQNWFKKPMAQRWRENLQKSAR